ncbi:unnamed protein product [Pedinophyceae sp. YPF-701]|nr:unnamed protein product [Pedinophyceae sp. YPF-701]
MSTSASRIATTMMQGARVGVGRRGAGGAVVVGGRSRSIAARATNTKWMDYKPFMRKLGDSELLVPDICLGTMTWGVQNTEEEAHEQLSFALDCGINFLDTAEMYPVPPTEDTQGRTDRYIATWLKDQARDKITLATKVSGYSDKAYLRDGADKTRVDRANILESVDKSLARLGTDYVDLLQIHWPDRYVPLFGQAGYDPSQEREAVPFEEQLRALEEVVRAGKVRYIGVSNETTFGVCKFAELAAAHSLPKIVSIQNVYHLMARGAFETDLAEACAPSNYNVGLLAYSPLAGGALSGKYLAADPPKDSRLNLFPGFMERYKASHAARATAKYVEVAQKHGVTPTELALAYVKSRWFVASSIIGATKMDQLKEDIGAFTVELPDECLADVEAVHLDFTDPSMRA